MSQFSALVTFLFFIFFLVLAKIYDDIFTKKNCKYFEIIYYTANDIRCFGLRAETQKNHDKNHDVIRH